ncbi:selenocysteine insertion sequence-binding protein 2 [Venturia canescens]|uniref:selenocysteine insertion sequence-binding protein 2 n=1 Tax=Venturia canescens TaxID=32260 RepID=UPI001C9CE7CC|nr:selenocysteine insertion sequence-binding protein 2-like [Venturia canescens]
MNHHCWRNAKTRVNEDDEIEWPKLSSSVLQDRSDRKKMLRHHISSIHSDLPSSSNNHDPQESLDDLDYPKLGEAFIKRKQTFPECNQLAIVKHFHDRSERKFRIPSSTDLIEVDFRRTLERQNWQGCQLVNQGAKITVDICKLNVNMSLEKPLAKWLFAKSKRKITYIARKKKPSKLKGLILYDRMIKKQARAGGQKICEVMVNPILRNDLSSIDFGGLRINVVPHDDRELLDKMSALTCMSSDYRNPQEINIVEDNVIFRPDLHEQMENMTIHVKNESSPTDEEDNGTIVCNSGFIDLDTLEATRNLKISDEPGNSIVNVPNKPCRIQFSKKFREYCTNTVTPSLKSCLDDFLSEMLRLQKKIYERDRVKGKSKRRYHAGIKEVCKHIDLKKIKFVIIATDLEKVQMEGGLDDTLNKLLEICKKHEVPYCFGLGRRKLGYYTYGKGFTSCIGIVNYSGAEEKLKNVLCAVIKAKDEFLSLMFNDGKTIDVEKLLPREELLLSEKINAYLKIIAVASTS